MPSLFARPYKALVIGATGAIGGAFVRAFSCDPQCRHVHAISRSTAQGKDGFDLRDPSSIAAQAERAREHGPFEVMVDATGALVIDGAMPEKSLSQLSPEALLNSLAINTVGPAMVLRHFSPLLASGDAIYAKLSARVGSISDNRLGGWYGYRSAKAALNMLLQTAAIELQRKNALLRVVALQPGTVDSALSKPFQGGVQNLLTPEASVQGMLQALADLPPTKGASFIDHQGRQIGW